MQESTHPDLVSVTTTVATLDDARQLARALVEARVAACVQLDAIAASVYRWEGRLCEEGEVRLTIKTTPQRLPQLRAELLARHPYELPQFVVTPCGASEAYAAWVRGETGDAP